MTATSSDPIHEAFWREAFDALADVVPDFAGKAGYLLTGFAACVDKLIDLHAVAPALKEEPAARPLFDALMARAKSGRGGEVRVDWPGGPAFLDAFVKADAMAVGGASAQAATALAAIGAPAVMALGDRSADQLAVLHPAIDLVAEDGGLIAVGNVPPAGSGKPAHYIVEYSADRPLPDFTPERSTRVIVRFADEGLDHDSMFEKYARGMGAGAGAALLSSPNAVEANDLPDALDFVASFALAWKEAGSIVHLELGEFAVPGGVDQTLRKMSGAVTSIGLNFNEMSSARLDSEISADDLIAFAGRQGVSRVVVHADPWALALTQGDPERELDALAMGCLLASARAEAGRPVAKPRAPSAANFAPPPFPAISPCADPGWTLVCCPSPYLRNPASTIGLGDTFTAGSMLVHAGPRRSPIVAGLAGYAGLAGGGPSLRPARPSPSPNMRS